VLTRTYGDYFVPGTLYTGGKGHKNRHSAALMQPLFHFDGATGSMAADRSTLGPGGTRGAYRAAKNKAEVRLVCCSGRGGHVSAIGRLKIRLNFIWFAGTVT
jgi:hypothetical protein